MTPNALLAYPIQRFALGLMHEHHGRVPTATCTELAEATAIYLDHEEWLDDPDHWIWDLAFSTTQETDPT
jgi:hypothetical protein